MYFFIIIVFTRLMFASLSSNSRPNSILLVGEGNFSFSSAFLKKLSSANPPCYLATSFESFNDCLEKYGRDIVLKNIGLLEENGGKALHNVDATNLFANFSSVIFNTIIFQFPHTGRKASIKRNRDLLKNFFLSSAPLLSPDGSIIVTLCAGQGGTSLDSVQREHCNSWQIVDMAVYSGLILVEVEAFSGEMFPGYQPTGKRNAGNKFHTHKAMSHRFVIASNPPALSPNWKAFKDLSSLPSRVADRVKLLIDDPASVPQFWITKEIVEHLECGLCNNKEIYSTLDRIMKVIEEQERKSLFSHHFQNIKGVYCKASVNAKKIDMTDIPLTSPMQYKVQFIFLNNPLELQEILNKFSSHTVLVEKEDCCCTNESFLNAWLKVDKDIPVLEHNCTSIAVISSGQRSNFKKTCIGCCCEILLKLSNSTVSLCIANLDVDAMIAAINTGIFRNQRTMWSLNKETRQLVIQALKMKKPYVPKSICPPCYVHDLSFWVNAACPGERSFTEEDFIWIILNSVDDLIVKLELLDSYEQQHKKSLCFRAVYQSNEFALSKDQCLKLQDIVRRNVCDYFDVSLR